MGRVPKVFGRFKKGNMFFSKTNSFKSSFSSQKKKSVLKNAWGVTSTSLCNDTEDRGIYVAQSGYLAFLRR